MRHDELKALSDVRMEQAEECLFDAKLLLERERYKSAANRSYYAVFHAMRAVLAYDEFDSKRHSGVISEFRKRYIKTGVFESAMSKTIGNLFDIRTDSDYEDYYVLAKDDVAEQVKNAEYFLEQVKTYLSTK